MHLSLRLLFLCFPLTLSAQQPLQFTRLTAENGLSNNSVQCLLQDRQGIVWIGTNGGLDRYDGSSFIQYNLLSRPALSNSIVTALMEDAEGYIWIGTENGLHILDPIADTLRTFLHEDHNNNSLPQGPVRVIQKMPDGSTWVLSEKWMVRFSGRSSFSPIYIDSTLIQDNMVFTGAFAPNDRQIWISYLDQQTILAGRSQRQGAEHITSILCKAGDYAKIYADSLHTTWGISSQGIKRFNPDNRQFENWMDNEHAPHTPNLHLHTCFCMDADGNAWQGTDRASLVKYDLGGRKVIDYTWLLKTNNAAITYCIYRDKSNNIWIGTDNGIIRISNRSSLFDNIPFTRGGSSLTNMRCRRIIEDSSHRLYASTENYGLLKWQTDASGRSMTTPLSTFGARAISSIPFTDNCLRIRLNGTYDIGYIYDMWYDGGDIIWMAGFGIARYDIRTDSLQVFLSGGDEISRNESVNQFAICTDGRLFWTAGQHNLYTFDPATRQMHPFRDRSGVMPFHDLACWSLIRKGDWIWAGTAKGLYKVNIHNREVVKVPAHPVLEFGINDIHIDKDSSFWISSAGGGVVHYNDSTGSAKQYTNADGLSNNTVCGILQDGKGNCWISTYAGLCYFDRTSDRFTTFYAKDGLNTDEFNRKAFTRLNDGRMIFGGLNGYNIFNPDDAFKKDKPVSILLTRFSRTSANGDIGNRVFNMSGLQTVTIDPGDKFFSFHFALTDMYDPAGNRYMYMVQGLDNAWHSIGNQNFVSFNALPPGNYTLRIKGNPGKGFSSGNELAIGIHVRQVFYRTIWFFLLMLLAAATITYMVIRYRIRQLNKIQYLRTRIASDLHDEVGSSLVHITMLADTVKRAENGKAMETQLSSISDISRSAVSTIKDIIWSIDARYDTMAGMTAHMRDHIHSLLAPADIDFEFVENSMQGDEKLPAVFRQNVYLIFKEAINNIVKHSGAAHVRIGLERTNGSFSMSIRDDGNGLPNDRRSNGQGLRNMLMRAERLKGRLMVESDKGVVITLEVPV